MYNPLYQGNYEAEGYFQNAEDIINEEDFEESIDESRRPSPTKMSHAKLDEVNEDAVEEKQEEQE